jgi:superfamily II DNA/RNA helicase
MKPQVAKSIIEKLNLASIIVVDEMSDVAHVIHDSELTDGYSVVSIRGEAKDNDSKKVLAKLISNVGKK